METYFTIGTFVISKLPNSHLWVIWERGKKMRFISYLQLCSILANLWIKRKKDRFAIDRYESGEFGFGGFQYDMAKRMNRDQHKLTNLILQF